MSGDERFRRALIDGDLAGLRELARAGADLDQRIDAKRSKRETNRDVSPDGFTALHLAAYEDDGELAALLLRLGADPWIRTRFGATPLGLAATWRSPRFVTAFLAAGHHPDAGPEQPLVLAAARGDRETTRLLLAAGAQKGMNVAVGSACGFEADPAILTMLLDAGAAPVAPADPEDWTPRVHALYGRRDECLRILATRTPAVTLHDAAVDGDLAAVEHFLENGSDADAPLRHGITPLVAAASRGHLAVTRVLLDAGANPGHVSVLGSPLQVALRGEHLLVADELERRGAPLVEERYGSIFGQLIGRGLETAFAWLAERGPPPLLARLLGRAAKTGDLAALQCLLALGANPNGDGSFDAPLALAAYTGRTAAVELLLARGANPRLRDPFGRPLLHYVLTYDDYSEDWCVEDFDPARYDRQHPILESEAVKRLVAAGAPLPWVGS